MGYYVIRGVKGRKINRSVIRTNLSKQALVNKGKRQGYSSISVTSVKKDTAWNMATRAGQRRKYRFGSTIGFRIR